MSSHENVSWTFWPSIVLFVMIVRLKCQVTEGLLIRTWLINTRLFHISSCSKFLMACSTIFLFKKIGMKIAEYVMRSGFLPKSRLLQRFKYCVNDLLIDSSLNAKIIFLIYWFATANKNLLREKKIVISLSGLWGVFSAWTIKIVFMASF